MNRSTSGKSWFSKCFLSIFALTFKRFSFTKKGFVASFHVTQAEIITFFDCLRDEKVDYLEFYLFYSYHRHDCSKHSREQPPENPFRPAIRIVPLIFFSKISPPRLRLVLFAVVVEQNSSLLFLLF